MDKFRKLRIYNLVMGFLHTVQGIAMLLLSNTTSLPVTTHYLKFNQFAKQLLPVEESIFEIQLGPIIALFLFLSATAHLLLTTPRIFEWYKANLQKGANYARWFEYSLSSSVMIIVISMLVGIYDLSTLILAFLLNAMMIFFGLMMERHNQLTEKTDWSAYLFGCIAGAGPWIAIALHLFGSGEGDLKPPTFVYWIFFSIFLFFNIFALNMVLQYKKTGKWKDYLFGEKVYILLSLVAKSLLAWQVFAGTLRPV